MTVSDLQSVDAVFLFVISACCLIYVAEDRALSRVLRLTIAAVGFFAFAQALWAVTKWSPALPYPWARVALDAALCSASIARVWSLAIVALGRATLFHAGGYVPPEVHHLDQPRRHRAHGG